MELFDKYNLLIINKQRFYKEDLSNRDFLLECTSPYMFSFNSSNIKENTWTNMLLKIVELFLKKAPKSTKELLEFKTDWSKAPIFLDNPKVNCSELSIGIYLNVNHTALHSVWLIQDLIKLFNLPLEECSLIIRRPPYIEPEEIVDYIEKETILKFKEFLYYKKYDQDRIEKVVRNIKFLNKYLSKISKAYNNFYLFDNLQYLSNYKAKFFKDLSKVVEFNDKQIALCHKYLDLLTEFYGSEFNQIF